MKTSEILRLAAEHANDTLVCGWHYAVDRVDADCEDRYRSKKFFLLRMGESGYGFNDDVSFGSDSMHRCMALLLVAAIAESKGD